MRTAIEVRAEYLIKKLNQYTLNDNLDKALRALARLNASNLYLNFKHLSAQQLEVAEAVLMSLNNEQNEVAI